MQKFGNPSFSNAIDDFSGNGNLDKVTDPIIELLSSGESRNKLDMLGYLQWLSSKSKLKITKSQTGCWHNDQASITSIS